MRIDWFDCLFKAFGSNDFYADQAARELGCSVSSFKRLVAKEPKTIVKVWLDGGIYDNQYLGVYCLDKGQVETGRSR